MRLTFMIKWYICDLKSRKLNALAVAWHKLCNCVSVSVEWSFDDDLIIIIPHAHMILIGKLIVLTVVAFNESA